jgi:hypothetical protein
VQHDRYSLPAGGTEAFCTAPVVIAEDKRATKAVPFALRAIELLVLPIIIVVPHGPADPFSTRAQTRTTTQSDYAEQKNTYDLNT